MAALLLESIAADGERFLQTGDNSARQALIALASALIQELENPGEQLARIGWGEPTRTAALRTLFDLKILQKLGQTPQGSEQLAAGTESDPILIGMISAIPYLVYVALTFYYSTSSEASSS